MFAYIIYFFSNFVAVFNHYPFQGRQIAKSNIIKNRYTPLLSKQSRLINKQTPHRRINH